MALVVGGSVNWERGWEIVAAIALAVTFWVAAIALARSLRGRSKKGGDDDQPETPGDEDDA
jgi:hypothetical protein